MARLTRWLKTYRLRKLCQDKAGVVAWLAYMQQPAMECNSKLLLHIADTQQYLGEIDEKINQLKADLG